MKITLSSTGQDMKAGLDRRFGRCAYFVAYDTATKEARAVRNPAGESGGGAGVKAAQIVIDTGADVVITGNVGPNALDVLLRGGVRCFTAVGSVTLEDAVADYEAGKLNEIKSATVGPHTGMGGGGGRGRR
jgi:predicted Fe-Mo cluster-binding NifX family protein